MFAPVKLRLIGLFLFSLFATNSWAQDKSITCRFLMTMQNAFDNSHYTDSVLTRLENVRDKSAVQKGQMGVLLTLKGKHAFNPFNKYRYVKNGLTELSGAIEKAPEDLSLRFFRISIEENIPAFLQMSSHLNEDKKKLLNLAPIASSKHDQCLLDAIYKLAKNSSRFSTDEAEMLKTHIYAHSSRFNP